MFTMSEIKWSTPALKSLLTIVHRSWAFQIVRFDEYWKRIFICIPAKFNWHKNWNQQIVEKCDICWMGFGSTTGWKLFKTIIFSYETHFHLFRYVDKQNCRIWSTENPRQMQQHEMHSQRTTVWCDLWTGDVIVPNGRQFQRADNYLPKLRRWSYAGCNFSLLNRKFLWM